MINSLCERLGKRRPELLRGLISEKFLKVFPKYAEKKGEAPAVEVPEIELSPEQLCEQAGGKVQNVEGTMMCVIQISSSMQRKVPLSKPELFKR